MRELKTVESRLDDIDREISLRPTTNRALAYVTLLLLASIAGEYIRWHVIGPPPSVSADIRVEELLLNRTESMQQTAEWAFTEWMVTTCSEKNLCHKVIDNDPEPSFTIGCYPCEEETND